MRKENIRKIMIKSDFDDNVIWQRNLRKNEKKINKLIDLKQVNRYAAKFAQCNVHSAPFWTILFGICSHWILYKSKPKFQTKCILIQDQRKKRSPTCIEMWVKNLI